jgi:hypothetical protein
MVETIRTVEMQPLRDGAVYRLTLWDTGRTDWRGQSKLGYRFERLPEPSTLPQGMEDAPEPGVLFEGEDFAGSPMHASDSDETLAALLTFLCLRPGDTDREYFESYSPEQLAWAGSYDCEVLACEVSMLADAEPDAEPVWQDVEPEPGE